MALTREEIQVCIDAAEKYAKFLVDSGLQARGNKDMSYIGIRVLPDLEVAWCPHLELCRYRGDKIIVSDLVSDDNPTAYNEGFKNDAYTSDELSREVLTDSFHGHYWELCPLYFADQMRKKLREAK